MTFEFYRFRFHFRAAGSLSFAPYQSGNIVRGAFGTIFRKLACRPSCTDAATCDVRTTCPYARIFEPQAARGEGPSGLADWPRPFVFRASHLDGCIVAPGRPFHFDVHLFDVRQPPIPHFVAAFERLAREGLGPGRGRADLIAVDQLDREGETVVRLFDGNGRTGEPGAPERIDLFPAAEPASGAVVRFVTPTELKGGDDRVEELAFGVLFARLRDRISNLRALYGSGPLAIDFRAMGERAALVRTVRCDLVRVEADRRSSRTGRRHPLGGFAGEAEYAGDLTEFVPYLRAGRWTGVGRQTVWGKGEIHTSVPRGSPPLQ